MVQGRNLGWMLSTSETRWRIFGMEKEEAAPSHSPKHPNLLKGPRTVTISIHTPNRQGAAKGGAAKGRRNRKQSGD